MAFADELHQQFPVEVEAVALEGQALEAFAPENFIHRERILQPDEEGDVDQEREAPVCEVQDEGLEGLVGKFTDGPTALAVTGAEDEFLPAGGEGREQDVVVVEVVFEVGVLDEDDIAGGVGEAGADGVTFAAGTVFEDEFDPRVGVVGLDDGAGAVGRITLDHNNLEGPTRDGFREDGVEGLAYGRGLVVDRDDDGERAVDDGREGRGRHGCRTEH